MNKIEIIKIDSVTRYVLKSKKGYYLTENDGWTKNLKNAYYFASCQAASYMRENDFKSCKVVEVKLCTWQAVVRELKYKTDTEVKLRTWQAVEEIGEVK